VKEDTSIGGRVVCGTRIEVLGSLRRLLEHHGVEGVRQGLLILGGSFSGVLWNPGRGALRWKGTLRV
jgi:hypothetical protein